MEAALHERHVDVLILLLGHFCGRGPAVIYGQG